MADFRACDRSRAMSGESGDGTVVSKSTDRYYRRPTSEGMYSAVTGRCSHFPPRRSTRFHAWPHMPNSKPAAPAKRFSATCSIAAAGRKTKPAICGVTVTNTRVLPGSLLFRYTLRGSTKRGEGLRAAHPRNRSGSR